MLTRHRSTAESPADQLIFEVSLRAAGVLFMAAAAAPALIAKLLHWLVSKMPTFRRNGSVHEVRKIRQVRGLPGRHDCSVGPQPVNRRWAWKVEQAWQGKLNDETVAFEWADEKIRRKWKAVKENIHTRAANQGAGKVTLLCPIPHKKQRTPPSIDDRVLA